MCVCVCVRARVCVHVCVCEGGGGGRAGERGVGGFVRPFYSYCVVYDCRSRLTRKALSLSLCLPVSVLFFLS